MVKKIMKYAKFMVCIILMVSLVAPSYAALSASDGSAFVTKAEFDSALADFNARLTTFEAGINSKIDSQVSSYLDRNGIWNAAKQTVYNNYTNTNTTLNFKDGDPNVVDYLQTYPFDVYKFKNVGWLRDADITDPTKRFSENHLMIEKVAIYPDEFGKFATRYGKAADVWAMKQTVGPFYEHSIRNGYSNLVYFVCNKSGLAHLTFATDTIYMNSNFDVLFWGPTSSQYSNFYGNLYQVAITKEYHLNGFPSNRFTLGNTGKITTFPAVDAVADTSATIATLNVGAPLNVQERLDHYAIWTEGVQGNASTADTNRYGNYTGFSLLQLPSFVTNVSAFAFVSKGWAYFLEVYTGHKDKSNRAMWANNQEPCIFYKNTPLTVNIY